MNVHICTHSHVPVRSPFLRKSKIAVSLNSFPLAAQTAFVLQTKRKRNETEGSEEAGRRRERDGPGQGAEKEGDAEGEADKGKSEKTARDRQQGWGLNGKQLSPPSTRTQVSPTAKPQRYNATVSFPLRGHSERGTPGRPDAWHRGNLIAHHPGPTR